jgi:hypothetical protein
MYIAAWRGGDKREREQKKRNLQFNFIFFFSLSPSSSKMTTGKLHPPFAGREWEDRDSDIIGSDSEEEEVPVAKKQAIKTLQHAFPKHMLVVGGLGNFEGYPESVPSAEYFDINGEALIHQEFQDVPFRVWGYSGITVGEIGTDNSAAMLFGGKIQN